MRIERLFSVTGWALIEASMILPWMTYNGVLSLSIFDLDAGKWFVPWLVALGGILALISRYGGTLTLAGLLVYATSPSINFCECTINSMFGPGFWFALIGTLVSFGGLSWNIPAQWIEERKGIGAFLFSIGITALAPGAFLSINGFIANLAMEETIPAIILLTSGLLMTTIGLGLFLSWRTPFSIRNIRRLVNALFGRSKPP